MRPRSAPWWRSCAPGSTTWSGPAPASALSGLPPGTHELSPLLADLVGTALDAAESSGGLVDPTVGGAMQGLGYDRSIELLPADGAAVRRVQHVPGWRRVHLYGDRL